MPSTINIQDKIILNPTNELCFMKSSVYHVDLYEYAIRHVRLYEKVYLRHYGVTMTSLRNESCISQHDIWTFLSTVVF